MTISEQFISETVIFIADKCQNRLFYDCYLDLDHNSKRVCSSHHYFNTAPLPSITHTAAQNSYY